MKTENLVITSFEEYCVMRKKTYLLTYMSDNEKTYSMVVFKPNEQDAKKAVQDVKKQIETIEGLITFGGELEENAYTILSKDDIKLLKKMKKQSKKSDAPYVSKLMKDRLRNMQSYYSFYLNEYENTGIIYYYKNNPYVYPYRMGDFYIRDVMKKNKLTSENEREVFFLLNRLIDLRFGFALGIEKVCEAYCGETSLIEIVEECKNLGLDDVRCAHDIELLSYHLTMGEVSMLLSKS